MMFLKRDSRVAILADLLPKLADFLTVSCKIF